MLWKTRQHLKLAFLITTCNCLVYLYIYAVAFTRKFIRVNESMCLRGKDGREKQHKLFQKRKPQNESKTNVVLQLCCWSSVTTTQYFSLKELYSKNNNVFRERNKYFQFSILHTMETYFLDNYFSMLVGGVLEVDLDLSIQICMHKNFLIGPTMFKSNIKLSQSPKSF